MSVQPPSTQAIAENVVAQLESAISQTVPMLPKAFCRVLAKAIAGVFTLLFKYCSWIFLQLFVAHASMRETVVLGKVIRPLVEWGRLIGVGDPEPAVQAELVIEVTVENQVDSLPGGSQLLRVPTGVVYQTVAAVPLDDSTVQVTIRAASDQNGGDGSGAIGNLQPGDEVEFANPLPNVATVATVVSVSVQGAEEETEDAYRGRIIRRFQRRPQGGAYADYQAWGEEVAGILNVYPYTGDPGEVDVYVEATVESSGDPDGIPTQPQLDAVAASIELDEGGVASRRPANAAVNVLPITRQAFDVILGGLDASEVDGGESAVLAAIEEGVDDWLRGREPFLVGLTPLPRQDRITQGAIAGVVMGIAEAEGATVATVTVERGSLEITEYQLAHGEKAKLGTLS